MMRYLARHRKRATHRCIRLLPLLLVALVVTQAAQAQLRIVSYNTTTADPEGGFTTPRTGTDIVFKSIGDEPRNGFAKPIDVLLLQEQYTMDITTEAFVALLNNIYGAGTYARGDLDGLTSDSMARAGRPGIVYNTQTVQLLEEVPFGTVNSSNQARSTMRYKLKPVGYDASAIFYAYNDHYKAGTAASDPDNPIRRGLEATNIRTHATYGSNALGEGAHAIFAGDHNTYTSSEAAIVNLTAAGAGEAVDPINSLGSWTNNVSYAAVHTQSPCLSSCIGATGGMDDRFDFQFVTGEMLDGEGLSVIDNSYHGFGNNGTTFNKNITDASNTYSFPAPPVMTYTKSQILSAIRSASDHIPVVADYQLPAVMQALAGSIPTQLTVGQVFDLGVAVSNAANVPVPIGADELDYLVSATDALTAPANPPGGYTDWALGGENTHFIHFDTSTPGMKSGTIMISSTSQQVQNGLINIPISYQVIALALAGDYNQNGEVDAADYATWRDTLGQSVAGGTGADGSGNGLIDAADYDVWTAHFGETTGSTAATGLPIGAIPEPNSTVLLILGVCLARLASGTLRGWTRRN